MITAVDTNVLLDVFGGDSRFGPSSRDTLRLCLQEGSLIGCDIVWAEVGACFPSTKTAREAMERLGVGFAGIDETAALAAGEAWRRYRQRGGQRLRILPDFLIGAHALLSADRLLTRDRGFYRTVFLKLKVLDPSLP